MSVEFRQLRRAIQRVACGCLVSVGLGLAPAAYGQPDAREDGIAAHTIAVARPIDLRFYTGKTTPPRTVHIVLRERDRCRATLRTLRFPIDLYRQVVVSRFDASPEDVAAALGLAQKYQTDLASPPVFPEGADNDTKAKMWSKRRVSRRMISGILGAAAEPQELVAGDRVTAWQAFDKLLACAAAENTRGTLQTGLVQARLAGEDAPWRIGAAGALARYGLLRTTREISEDLLTSDYPLASSAWALLAFDGPEALETARSALRRLREQTGDRAFHFESPVISNLSVPLVAFLLVHGDDADLEDVGTLTLGPAHALIIALLTDDPPTLLEAATAAGYYAEHVQWVVEAAAAIPPDQAADAYDELVTAAEARFAVAFAENPKADSGLERRKMGLRSSWFRPDPEVATEFYKGSINSEETTKQPWMGLLTWARLPELLNQGLSRLTRGDEQLIEHLWDVPRALIAARAGDADFIAAFEYPDLAAAYLRCFVPAYQGPASIVGATDLRRAYLVRHVEGGGDGGGITGVMTLRPQIIDSTLRLGIKFDQTASYKSGSFLDFKEGKMANYDHHRYVADAGRRLIAGVRVKGGRTILPVVARPRRDGWFIYEAPLPRAEVEGLVVQVNLGFFEDDLCFAFDLATTSFGREWRGAEMRSAPARKAMEVRNDDAANVAFGESLVDMGQITDASGFLLESALARRDADAALRTIDLLMEHGLYSGAARAWDRVIEAQLAADSAWFDLGAARLRAGEYEGAAAAFAKVLTASAEDHEARTWLALSALLAGDRKAAAEAISRVPAESMEVLVLALRYILAEGPEAAKAAADTMRSQAASRKDDARLRQVAGALLAIREYAGEVDEWSAGADRCRILCYEGYVHLRAGRKQQAAERFKLAAELGDQNQIERMMAVAEHERLSE